MIWLKSNTKMEGGILVLRAIILISKINIELQSTSEYLYNLYTCVYAYIPKHMMNFSIMRKMLSNFCNCGYQENFLYMLDIQCLFFFLLLIKTNLAKSKKNTARQTHQPFISYVYDMLLKIGVI